MPAAFPVGGRCRTMLIAFGAKPGARQNNCKCSAAAFSCTRDHVHKLLGEPMLKCSWRREHRFTQEGIIFSLAVPGKRREPVAVAGAQTVVSNCVTSAPAAECEFPL